MNKKYYSWFYIFVGIVICLGIFFRVVNIDKKVYWHDEVHTSIRVAGYSSEEVAPELFTGKIITVKQLLKYQKVSSNKSFNDAINAFVEHPEHPPLYYISQRFWQQLFGNSIVSYRSLSALFGILILPAIYWFSWELFGSIQISLIATTLIAVSPLQILYAQEARQYSLWILLTIINSLFFIKALKTKKVLPWSFYLVTSIFSFYTSLLSTLLLIVQVVYLIFNQDIKKYNNWFKFIICALITIVCFIPWIQVIIINYDKMKGATDWLKQDKSLLELNNGWGVNFGRLFADFSFAQYNRWSDLIVIFAYILIIFSSFYLLKNTSKNIWLYLVLLFVIPFLTLAIPDIISGSVRSTVTRYLVAYYISIPLIISYWLASNITKSKNPRSWLLIYIFIITVGIMSNLDIMQQVTWWNKSLGYQTNYITHQINQLDKPLIMIEQRGISIGIITSIAHTLTPTTSLLLINGDTQLETEKNFNHLFVINPSSELITKVEDTYQKKLNNNYKQESFDNPAVYYLEIN